MSNLYTSGSDNASNGSSGNSSSFVSRREIRASHVTGALPAITTSRSYSSSFDFEALLVSLHELFEHDRQVASQPDSTRCGICYLYYCISELHYRDEGFYVCQGCERALGKQTLPMLRNQQR